MELMVKNKNAIREIVKLAVNNGVEPVGWFDFCSLVSDVWFNGELTWEQKDQINKWAWDVKQIAGIEYVYGAIINAYK